MNFLETERLILRPLEMSDVDALPGIFPTPWRCATTPVPFGLWAAILKDSPEFAAQCGLVVQEVDGRDEVEIGYHFLRKFWCRGLASEATQACRDYAFDTLGYDRVVSLIDPSNLASRRVAEKVGMTLEKHTYKWN